MISSDFPEADDYWTEFMNYPIQAVPAGKFHLVPHGRELDDYWGIYAFFRGRSAIISCPPAFLARAGGLLGDLSYQSPDELAATLAPVAARIIGPAYLGYARQVAEVAGPVRALDAEDERAVESLEQACDAAEWEHGGSSLDCPVSGAFVGEQLVAMAGYEVWGGRIAHISVVTHPEFRGKGFGRAVVSNLARRAGEAGMISQYRTLESNLPSIRIAESLGFVPYATSVAARLVPVS